MTNQQTIFAKKAAAKAAIEFIQADMLVGLGTGSTTLFFIKELEKKCREGLQIKAVASSLQTAQLARKANIPLLDPTTVSTIDITIDGADEVCPLKYMIKGGGGALLREKLLAQGSKKIAIIVDESKIVSQLGKRPVPVEIFPFIYLQTLHRIEEAGYQGKLRIDEKTNSLYQTDNGNYIYDVHYPSLINNPIQEHIQLKQISGIVETGLFFHLPTQIIVGYKDGTFKIRD
jgi:ribose 5-phosphate isomerase A